MLVSGSFRPEDAYIQMISLQSRTERKVALASLYLQNRLNKKLNVLFDVIPVDESTAMF